MSKKQGKKFSNRSVKPIQSDGTVAQANQWTATEQQLNWLRYYMDPKEEETYANSYQSAIKAGYSESYAKNIMSNAVALQWVKSAKSIMRSMNTEHLKNVLEEIALGKYSKDADKISAVKALGMEQGMFVQKQITAHVGIEQALSELE